MTEVTTFPAPDLLVVGATEGAWERERRAFRAALPDLMTTHRGVYVAIHGGVVVADGPEKLDVARRAYERVGYVPVYVGLVSDLSERPVRVPSPRSVPHAVESGR